MITLVIGNGFDIDLGMNTRYSDFASSGFWPKKSVAAPCLQSYLEERKDMECWFDLEQCLLDYCKWQHGYASNKIPAEARPEEDIVYYKKLRDCLKEYLLSEQQKELRKDSWAGKLLRSLCEDRNFDHLYSFNYTDIGSIANKIGADLKNVEVDYVHGSLANDSIILGVDESEVEDGYEFLQKAVDVNYRSTNIISQLAISQEVFFFGHSFGTIDIEYFKPYFQHIFNQDIEGDQKHPTIVIFTYNEASRLQILKNIHNMQINRQRLFNLCNFLIFRTDGSDDERIESYLRMRESERNERDDFSSWDFESDND